MTGAWDEVKLDAFLDEIQSSFWEHMREDEAWNAQNPDAEEEHNIHAIVGFCMYKLLDCKTGAKLNAAPPRTISGPLFAEERR